MAASNLPHDSKSCREENTCRVHAYIHGKDIHVIISLRYDD